MENTIMYYEEVMIKNLYTLSETLAEPLLSGLVYPWEALPLIGDFICQIGKTLPKEEYEYRGDNVWTARDAEIFDSAYIKGPAIIGHRTQVRHGAFIRGKALVGDDAVVGNSVELKNVILFNQVQVPHYNYVGDSILGLHAHMGAGSITSNVKADNKNVVIHTSEGGIETGMRKVGAMLGDRSDVGCNTVLNPGTVLGMRVRVYPVSCVRGVIPADHIYKSADSIILRK